MCAHPPYPSYGVLYYTYMHITHEDKKSPKLFSLGKSLTMAGSVHTYLPLAPTAYALSIRGQFCSRRSTGEQIPKIKSTLSHLSILRSFLWPFLLRAHQGELLESALAATLTTKRPFRSATATLSLPHSLARAPSTCYMNKLGPFSSPILFLNEKPRNEILPECVLHSDNMNEVSVILQMSWAAQTNRVCGHRRASPQLRF